jgi:hypothetical protein
MAYRTDSTVDVRGVCYPLTVSVTTESPLPFDGKAVWSIRSGGAYIQTYPTAAECRQLSAAFAAAAADIDLIEQEAAIPCGEVTELAA